MRQPKTLKVHDQRYRLVIPYKILPSLVGETRSIGPLYERIPKDPDFQFLPDAPYLLGVRDKPEMMHRVKR